MTAGQIVLCVLIVILYCLTLGGIAIGVAMYLPEAFWGCIALETVLTVLIVLESFRGLKTDEMIAKSCLGHLYRVDTPPKLSGNHHGIFGTGLVPTFPPGLVKGHPLPVDAFDIPFRSNSGNTKKTPDMPMTPVTVFSQLTMKLPRKLDELRRVVQALGILDDTNLYTPEQVEYFDKFDDEGKPKMVPRTVPCIVKRLQEVLQGTWDEAVGRAIGKHDLEEARLNFDAIEKDIKDRLSEDGTGTHDAGLFDKAVVPLADVNVLGTMPSLPAAVTALSAETIAVHEAKAKIRKAVGDAAYIKEVSPQLTTEEGRTVFTKELVESLPDNTTLIVGDNPLTAVIGKFLGNKPTNP